MMTKNEVWVVGRGVLEGERDLLINKRNRGGGGACDARGLLGIHTGGQVGWGMRTRERGTYHKVVKESAAARHGCCWTGLDGKEYIYIYTAETNEGAKASAYAR